MSWAVTFGFKFVQTSGAEGLGTVAAGFAVGCVGGLAEKITKNRTSSMSPILEGILILVRVFFFFLGGGWLFLCASCSLFVQVPGSIAVLSIANAFEGNVSNGISFGLRFIAVSVSITVGLFLAGELMVVGLLRMVVLLLCFVVLGVLFVIPWRGKKNRLGREDPVKYLL